MNQYQSRDDVKDTKMLVWLNHFLLCFNKTEAARVAGYEDPQQSGWEVSKRLEPIIQRELKEKLMSADEALARLSSIASADIADLIHTYEDEDGKLHAWFSLEKAKKNGLTHLVKELEQTQNHTRAETTWKVKIHDSQEALNSVLKIHGKFVNKHEHSGPEGRPLVIEVVTPDEETD
jgi:phage terminase small subunit